MFELSEEQKLIQKSIHQFDKKELAPQAAHWDASEEFPWESVKKMAEVGLTGLRLPKIYGGAEADLVTTGIAFEKVARFDHNCAVMLCGSNITGGVLLYASDKKKAKFLPEIAKGKYILAFGAAEADHDVRIRCESALCSAGERLQPDVDVGVHRMRKPPPAGSRSPRSATVSPPFVPQV